MASKLKFQNVLLCEHAVEGGRNKHTLVNVYAGDIVVSELPAGLAFGVYTEYVPDKVGAIEIGLLLKLGGKPIAKAVVGATNTALGHLAVFILPLITLRVERDSVLEIIAQAEGYRDTKILSKRIFKGDVGATVPSAPSLPSSQSPRARKKKAS